MRVLIVDDEAPARAKLRRLLAREAGAVVVGEAADGEAAVKAIEALRPDLVLLDVQMPRLDGFGVVERLGTGRMPPVIFVTAFDAHAVRAFDVHAVDYLLKPVSPERFRRAIERARGVRQEPGASEADAPNDQPADLASRLDALLGALGRSHGHADRVLVEDGRRALFLRVEQIDRLCAERNYVRIVAGQESYQLRGTLGALVARLDPAKFLRINRSDVVRMDAVKELHPWSHGDYRIVMRDGTELTWSRRYRARADGLLGGHRAKE
jgi:two-component system LytT family response regulator